MVFKKNTFKQGHHIPAKKELSRGNEYIIMPAPEVVKLSMLQHIGAPANPIVEVGDYVKVGQKIGEKVGFISANIHSSVSGEVVKIEKSNSTRGNTTCIFIKNDFKDELAYELMDRDYKSMTSEEIIAIIDEAGITGLGGASFPTSVKLSPQEKIEDVIINAAECEPYLTSDDTMMRNFADKIITGLKIEMQVLNAENGYIVIEDDKPEAIAKLEEAINGSENIKLVVAKAKYPQGDEKRIIQVATGKELPLGELPAVVGCVVSNATTAAAITDAVVHNKPLYERIVTFTGEAMNTKTNSLVRFGTTLGDALKELGGLKDDVAKLIIGGPMMGFAQDDLGIPLDKPTNGLLALSVEEAEYPDQEPCIKCSACVEVCPVYLQPFNLEELVRNGDLEGAQTNDIMACIECGLCSYICPSHIPLAETFKEGKQMIRQMNIN